MFDMYTGVDIDQLGLLPDNNDLGAAVAHDLGFVVEAIEACVDYSEDSERYEASLFRFPEKQKQAFAALEYLRAVETIGHDGYFASALSYGFEDARECFAQQGNVEVVDLMNQAAEYAAGAGLVAVGQYFPVVTNLTKSDRDLASLDPINCVRAFTRVNRQAFARW